MENKHDNDNIQLTSSEVAQLWATYMSDSMAKCVTDYFHKIASDPDIISIIDQISIVINRNLNGVTSFFAAENHCTPQGFTKEDVNLNAKDLYSETFVLHYIKHAAKNAVNSYSNALTISTRWDVRRFFTECIYSATDIYNRAVDVLLDKGIYIRPPLIPIAQKVEFVETPDFLKGIIGEKRPLNAMEIAQLHANIRANVIGVRLITGFAQTSKNKKVKEFMVTGKDISMKHIDLFADLLKESDIISPSSWDSAVTESTEAPFSEKLMMFHITALISFSILAYGSAIANSMRSDLSLTFARLIAELGDYAKKGADIMIENAWLEKIPEAANRKELINA